MDEEAKSIKTELSTNSQDRGLAVAKGALGAIPFIGPFAAEILNVSIPNQRTDRVTAYLHEVEDRVTNLEKATLEASTNSPDFIDLYEDGCRAAARSKTEIRIKALAKLTADSLTIEGRTTLEQSRYMRVLNQLDDQEIMLLRYLCFGNKKLMPPISTDPRQRMLDRALDNAAYANLLRLGLIEQEDKIVQRPNRSLNGQQTPPVLSKGKHKSTNFAHVFLDHIGLGQSSTATLERFL